MHAHVISILWPSHSFFNWPPFINISTVKKIYIKLHQFLNLFFKNFFHTKQFLSKNDRRSIVDDDTEKLKPLARCELVIMLFPLMICFRYILAYILMKGHIMMRMQIIEG